MVYKLWYHSVEMLRKDIRCSYPQGRSPFEGSLLPLGILTLAFVFSACSISHRNNPWRQAQTPTATPSESIGSYAAGCLRGAVPLEMTGEGFQVMRPSRHRFYGHPRLISFIKDLARNVAAQNLDPLLIGDLGQPKGGPTMSSHASHQTGLEVDIWYMHAPKERVLTAEEREKLESPPLVNPDFAGLNQDWHSDLIEILKLAASDPRVDRMFVNPVIKKTICDSHRGEPWVAKLRPWWDHDDHFHVRLKCSEQDARCNAGAEDPLAPGDGCDATLDAWFTPEKKAEEKRMREHPQPSRMPKLPRECRKVLKE